MTGANYTLAVLHLPGQKAELLDLSATPDLTESEAWNLARRRCTPSQRVVGVYQSRVRYFAVQNAQAAIDHLNAQGS